MNELLNIPVSEICPPSIVMMLVDTTGLSYMELRDSIRSEGILQNLTVKKSNQSEYKYELVTGLRRYTVAKELDLELVPVMIIDAPDADMIVKQIQENCCRENPSNLQLSLHFKRLLMMRRDLTFGDVACLVHKSPAWVRDILQLDQLTPQAKKFVDKNLITLTSAIVLSKLPKTVQDDLLESATELSTKDFLLHCRRTKKAYAEACRQGTLIEWSNTHTPAPSPCLRNLSVLRSEYEKCTAGSVFLEENPNLKPIEIWKTAIGWVLQLDKTSISDYYEKQEQFETQKRKRLAEESITKKVKKLVEKLKIKLDSTTRKLAEEFIF